MYFFRLLIMLLLFLFGFHIGLVVMHLFGFVKLTNDPPSMKLLIPFYYVFRDGRADKPEQENGDTSSHKTE